MTMIFVSRSIVALLISLGAIIVKVSGQVAPSSDWSEIYSTSGIVSVASFVMETGEILSFASSSRVTTPLNQMTVTGGTYTTLFDPETNEVTETLMTNTGHDMFCPGTSTLSDGRLVVTGGAGGDSVSIFNPITKQWAIGVHMEIGRGYHSQAKLPDGSILTLGGSWSGGIGGKVGEVWSPISNKWVIKPGISFVTTPTLLTDDKKGVYRADNHMWFFPAPDGTLFHAGPSKKMHWIDTEKEGSVTPISAQRGEDAMCGNAVYFDIGKILILGGAPDYDQDVSNDSAYVVDITGGRNGEVEVRQVMNMHFRRIFSSSIVLPTGEVIVVGGQGFGRVFTDILSVMWAEVWDPVTEEFTLLSRMDVPRNYHSVGVLMKDGRVFVAGGGHCGDFCDHNHPDAQILIPPYLYKPDGTLLTPEERPMIEDAPERILIDDDTMTVTMTDETPGYTFVAMQTGAATHATNNEMRRIPMASTQNTNNLSEYTVTIPSRNNLIPGTYFLFAMLGKVPSFGRTIKVDAPGPSSSVNEQPIPSNIRAQVFSEQCASMPSGPTGILGFFFSSFLSALFGSSGGALEMSSCDRESLDQQYVFTPVELPAYQIRSSQTDQCLEVGSNGRVEPADCVQGDSNQLWTVTGENPYQQVQMRTSPDLCLTVENASRIPGAALIVEQCGDMDKLNDKWTIDDRLSFGM